MRILLFTTNILDELLEGTVERRSQRLNILVEVDGGNRALGDTLGSELEFLQFR